VTVVAVVALLLIADEVRLVDIVVAVGVVVAVFVVFVN